MCDLVSIIMPSYNTGQYIGDSIRSVLAQTHENWELIIVDDGSTDDTEAVVSSFVDPRIRYFRNEKNSGTAISRNRALREAKGRWIAFLDSDDLWHPEKLEKQIAFMEENGYSFTYTRYSEVGENGRSLGRTVSGPGRITRRGMYNYCWPGCLTVMYDAVAVGLVQIKDIRKNNDYAMWLKVCHKADCYLLDETLARYHRREGSISRHGYGELIKWHYRLFRQVEGQSVVRSLFSVLMNIMFGIWKKIRYVESA